MSWIPSEKEVTAVLTLDGGKRYAHWLKKVADNQELWGLWQADGWALASDDSGRELIPVWPHSSYATVCAKEAWAGYQPKPISLDVWLSRWIPGIERDRRLVAVFPTPNDKGILVEPKRLAQDLRDELSRYG